MPCYHPIPAQQVAPGQKPRLFVREDVANLRLPCGKCLGCKTSRATMWAVRCMHEAREWPRSASFLTLTYADAHLPATRYLQPDHLQLFFKSLRRKLDRARGDGIRYMACGEYGDRGLRPHYHALVFNLGLSDLQPIAKELYQSELIDSLWKRGQVAIGECTPASAAYVAQYTMKKQGRDAPIQFDPSTGEVRPEPFLRMSLKPAIGAKWCDRNKGDLRKGYFTIDGKRHQVPRAYSERLKNSKDPSDIRLAQEMAFNSSSFLYSRSYQFSDASDPDRLRAAEVIHKKRKQLSERRSL